MRGEGDSEKGWNIFLASNITLSSQDFLYGQNIIIFFPFGKNFTLNDLLKILPLSIR